MKTYKGNSVEDQSYFEQILTYCLVILIATFAGIVKSIRKFQKVGSKSKFVKSTSLWRGAFFAS